MPPPPKLLPEDLFHTNRLPTLREMEILQAQDSVHEARLNHITRKINILEKKIHNLMATVEGLKQEKAEVLASHIPVSQALSPIRRLPEDVIREIFLACIDNNALPNTSSTNPPMIFTQICSGMRRIALGTPRLWASAWLNISNTSPMLVAKQTIAVREWLLNRSRNCELDITITESFEIEEESFRMYQEAIDVVLSCCSRWRKLYIRTQFTTLHTRLRSLTPSDVPSLNACTIDFLLYDDLSDGTTTQFNFFASQNLQQFAVLYAQASLVPILPVIWHNITHLTVDTTDLEEGQCLLAKVLQACSALVSLTLSAAKYSLTPISETHLPSLTFLQVYEHITASQDALDLGIVYAIIAPSLHTLVYSMDSLDADSKGLKMLLARSPNLKSLTVDKNVSQELLDSAVNRNTGIHRVDYLSIYRILSTFE